jgi:hypothetical protein
MRSFFSVHLRRAETRRFPTPLRLASFNQIPYFARLRCSFLFVDALPPFSAFF